MDAPCSNSNQSVSIEDLIQPISEDSPTGRDVREPGPGNDLYYQVKDARSQARTIERKALFAEDVESEAQDAWATILNTVPQLLKEHTKDLEITAWYIEALLRQADIGGLSDGFALAKELVERFWDQLYPMPDEDGLETRIAAFVGLNGESNEGTLIRPLRLVTLNDGLASKPFHYSDYQQARTLEKLKDEDQKASRRNEMGFNLADIQSAVEDSGPQHCQSMAAAFESALTHLNELGDRFYEHCSHEAPPTSLIKETLETVQMAFKDLAKKHLTSDTCAEQVKDKDRETQDTNAPSGTLTPAPQSTATQPTAWTGVTDRQQALQQLSQIADFFRRTEPHSPLAGQIDRAVRWGKMPLEQLILELLPSSDARFTYAQLTGVTLDGAQEGDVSTANPSHSETTTEHNTVNSTQHEGSW